MGMEWIQIHSIAISQVDEEAWRDMHTQCSWKSAALQFEDDARHAVSRITSSDISNISLVDSGLLSTDGARFIVLTCLRWREVAWTWTRHCDQILLLHRLNEIEQNAMN